MQILKFPDPILFQKCAEVTVFGPELKILLEFMWDAMKTHNGLGLSANQVGMKFRMFVMEGPDKEKIFVVNPVIKQRSIQSIKLREGCLSAPGESLALSERSAWIEISFKNEEGKSKVRVFKDIFAVCVQHEIDHLNGVSFLESRSLPKDVRKLLAKKWKIKKK